MSHGFGHYCYLRPVKAFLLIFIVLIGCTPAVTQKKRNKVDPNPKPEWMAARPATTAYYIGIGHSLKDPGVNHLQAAKKSALEDLISEIKVTVSGSSALTVIDANKAFREKYEQLIQTTVADEIEEYEQVGTWEDGNHFWVYYRLSKARYKEIKDKQKRDAVTLALDFFTKATQAERNKDAVLALGFYYQGFRSIEKYLADPIRIDFEGKEILLTNEIISRMQLLLDGMALDAQPALLEINRRVDKSTQAVMLRLTEKSTGRAITNMPLVAAFKKGAGDVFPDYKTDAAGQAKLLLTKIASRDLEQTVEASINLLAFAGNNPSEIYSLVSEKMVTPKVEVLFKVKRPQVFLTFSEKKFGTPKTNPELTNRIKNYLATNGFEFTDKDSQADLFLEVTADSEKGTVSGSIYVSFATAIIKVSDKAGREIYTTTIDRIKGLNLDYDRSAQEAYFKAIELMEKERLPALLNAILQ